MDNSIGASPSEWATPRLAAGSLLVGGVVLLVCAAAVAPDAVGAVVIGIAGLMLLGFGAYGWLIRPRLALIAGPTPTLTITRIGGAITLSPADVERVRVLSIRRIGRRARQLEIDYIPHGHSADESRLVVFGRWDLGTDLLSVADTLADAGFPVEDVNSPRA